MNSDPYLVLGLGPGATDDEVTKAYRKLARKYHPDINHGDPAAAERMSEINAAYEQIKSGSRGGAEAGGTAGYGFDPFEEFFGGGRGSSSEFGRIAAFVRLGRYSEVLNMLNTMGSRSAEWYYYSAVANSHCGNDITALKHARTAVQMEPDNRDYRAVLEQLENGGRAYNRQSRAYGMPEVNISRLCLGVALTNLFCFCCRPC